MRSIRHTLTYAGLGAALSAALFAMPIMASATEATSPSEPAATAASSEAAEETMLFIGREGATVEVPCASEATPDALIEALAEETGWNLELAGDIEVDDALQSVTVPLGDGNVVFTGDTEGVAADCAGTDRADLVYTVLNSIASTIAQNTPYLSVCFCTADGGPIEIEEDGFSFYLSDYCIWYEPNVVTTNEPLPNDVLGTYWPSPIGPSIAGWPSPNVVFARGGVEAGEGVITVTDSNWRSTCSTTTWKRSSSPPPTRKPARSPTPR